MTVVHDSFTLERTFSKKPAEVFAAWSREEAKNAWFGEGDTEFLSGVSYRLDCSVGGQEHLAGTLVPNGKAFAYDATYLDVVEDERLVCSYAVDVEGVRVSASLMTVELHEEAPGTRLVVTEQGAFFDDLDSNEQRIQGAADSLTQLEKYLSRP